MPANVWTEAYPEKCPEPGCHRVFKTPAELRGHLDDGRYLTVEASEPRTFTVEKWMPPNRIRFLVSRRKWLRTAARTRCGIGLIEINPRVMAQWQTGVVDTRIMMEMLMHELAHVQVGPRANHGPAFKKRLVAMGGHMKYPRSLESESDRQGRIRRRNARWISQDARIDTLFHGGSR